MNKDELRLAFTGAISRHDWPSVLEHGRQLHALGDTGSPPGSNAMWMEIAAGQLGNRIEAMLYSKFGLETCEKGSATEAYLLANGAYTSLRHGAPNRALRLCRRYLSCHAGYPSEAQRLKAMVLYYRSMAHEDRRDFDAAIESYHETLAEIEPTDAALAGMVRADLALAIVRQAAVDAVSVAQAHLELVDPDQLTDRGRFAYTACQAELALARQEFETALGLADRALQAAEELGPELLLECAQLHRLRARCAYGLGDRNGALSAGLQAARAFEALGCSTDLAESESFLWSVLAQRE